ncbi:hypothetical protein MMC22_010094 [Lobaria immixta]|nr:hypothetical protein [Lobaria immixta]
MGHIGEEIESNIPKFPTNLQNVTFVVHWDLRNYIRKELEKDQKLAHILTVSGDVKNAYSTTCADYVNRFWPNTGLWMLETLQIIIDRGSHCAKLATDATDTVIVNACHVSKGSMIFNVSSSREILISIAQQLAWLAAISKTSSFQELTSSHVLFRYVGAKEFIITVLDDRQLPKGDEMCWHPLFPDTVIAYEFPVPPRSTETGLELPFDIMLRLARITYAVTYDDGLVLSGFSTLIFPSAHHKPQSQAKTQSHSIQWHLVTSADGSTRISAGVELAQRDRLWIKINDEELLRSARTFLGHCKVSCVHLGTENSGFSDISQSSLADDKPNPTISVRSGTISTSGMGILGAAMNVEAVLPKPLARLIKSDHYNDILRTAKSMPIILYDADKQQAWLVPALSIILHMVHAWKAVHAPNKQLPYAKPDWDGGQAAWNIIAESSGLELEKSLEDGTPYFLKDLVKRLWEHLISCFDCTTLDTRRGGGTFEIGQRKLRGWEYRDIIDLPVRSKMKEQVLDRSGCGWEILTEDVLLLVCKGLGEVIQPAQPGSLCAEFYPVQQGMKYLTASVACLRHLSQNCGMGETCTQLAGHVFWPSPLPGLFDDCTHGDEKPCVKTLQRLVPKEVHGPTTAVPAEGAVLFGYKSNKLKKKASHSVKKLSKQGANGHVESANQGFVVNATHRFPGHNSHLLANGEPTVPSSQAAYSEGVPGFSSLALADEQCTGSSNQEMTDENTPRALAQSIPKAKAGFTLKPSSHIWRRVLSAGRQSDVGRHREQEQEGTRSEEASHRQ